MHRQMEKQELESHLKSGLQPVMDHSALAWTPHEKAKSGLEDLPVLCSSLARSEPVTLSGPESRQREDQLVSQMSSATDPALSGLPQR
jgi:hypothetical protein